MSMNRVQAFDLLSTSLHQVAPNVDLGVIDADAPFQEEVDIDSMDFLNLVEAIHQRSGIEIPERDYPRLASLEGFLGYLMSAPAGTTVPPRG